METGRYERGLEKLSEVDGAGGQKVIDSLREIAPDLGRYIIEFAFGDIYNRAGLDLQERELVTLASLLTAGGCEPQLEVHINGALNVGIPPEKVIEAFIQCIPYTGFPKVLNAVAVAKKVFGDRRITHPSNDLR
ncbi:carboxymuconolactone decarboxylase family protein [Gorillibacterium timonense]|uniref:carboxymuconolactone decarboxylase family protein n=1 Tax=Gorillibacterium timonense TaxID=1689269 RepID=UPI00071CD809|nr:carboxymuconolactone decarboxylase family protein [Gorillibacterium timonense]